MKKRFQYSNNHNLRVFLGDTPNTSMYISYNNMILFSLQITAYPNCCRIHFLKTPSIIIKQNKQQATHYRNGDCIL